MVNPDGPMGEARNVDGLARAMKKEGDRLVVEPLLPLLPSLWGVSIR